MRKREQTNKWHSKRKEAVLLHEEDNCAYKQITEKYGIQDKDRVRNGRINSIDFFKLTGSLIPICVKINGTKIWS